MDEKTVFDKAIKSVDDIGTTAKFDDAIKVADNVFDTSSKTKK